MKAPLLILISVPLLCPLVAGAQPDAGVVHCEASTAPFPDSKPGDKRPEGINVTSGGLPGQVVWAHGSGYIHAPIARVLAAIRKNPEVLVDRRNVDSFSVRQTGDNEWLIHDTVHNTVVVTFDTTWKAVVIGTAPAPTLVCARGTKAPGGSQYIQLIEDSIQLKSRGPSVTEIQIVRQLQAEATNALTAASYVNDVYDSLAALAKGKPLPTYPGDER